jgi:predicted  nucleic acid-binding Zn-ribbon protein
MNKEQTISEADNIKQQQQPQPQPQQQQQQQLPPQQQQQQLPPQQQPPPQQQQQQQQSTSSSSSSSSDEVDQTHNLQLELDKLNELIAQRTAEVQNEKRNKERLQNELSEAQRVFKEREVEYSAIEHSFFEHTRAIRATDDDLSTIRDSFKLLKYSIARLIMTLNKKADKAKAAEKFCQAWPNLSILDPTTNELEPSFINPLAEKLVHDHLVKLVFSCPIYPGLKVNEAYSALNTWLQQHQSQFSIRLRQQMAAVVAKSKPDSEIQQAAQKEKQNIAKKIYDDLADIYHPFLRENDAAVEEEKRYYSKICDIVDKALKLTIAIRGQEVEITTVAIEEGSKQPFEEETMTEVKGRTSGLVRFCICPTFMGGDREHGFLEKGKVVISG